MRVYIAAPWVRRPEAIAAGEQFKAAGHEVTSRWFQHPVLGDPLDSTGVTGDIAAIRDQALEDIALMRVLPGMVVVVPCDSVEAQKATVAIATNNQPSYIRLGREKTAVITTAESPFQIGRAEVVREGTDVSIVACGILVYQALLAAEQLAAEGIECRVINSHTIKPLDEATIITAARETGAIVSVEEHQIAGGLGSAVAEVLARNCPVPQEFIGMQDTFGESGTPDELIKAFGMDAAAIATAVKKVISRKYFFTNI